jgi:hypothetical protein
MRDLTKRMFCAAAVALTILVQPAYAAEEDMSKDPAGGSAIYDLVLARPVGLVGVVVGSVGFVLALPFTIPSGTVSKAAEDMVYKPVRFTFMRPLGEIEK